MKVLHVWDMCAVSCLLAKMQRVLFGWDSRVIYRTRYDPFDVIGYYGESGYDCSAFMFKLRALIKTLGVDLVHVHSVDNIVRRLAKFKPIILHYHGSEIRNRWAERQRYWRYATKILVSTPDLLRGAPTGVTYLPNPVDTVLFSPRSISPISGTAIHFIQTSDDSRWAEDMAKKRGLQLSLQERVVRYSDMPSVLLPFESLIDRSTINSLSKVALEGLAFGLKVIRWDGAVVEGMPIEHTPVSVAGKLKQIIEQGII